MNRDNKPRISLLKSFQVAFRGIFVLFRTERNFRIHTAIAILALAACQILGAEKGEWLIVLLLIGTVMGLEALNSCIERICDLISPQYNEKIKIIKDVAAGAVLVAAIVSVIAGCIIFIPLLINKLS